MADRDLRAEMDQDRELDELRSALRKAQRAASKKQIAFAELVQAVYEASKDAMLAHGPPRKIVSPKSTRSSQSPEAALLHLTDWQVGKRTGTFNMKRCRERIMQAATKAVELTELQRSHHPVPVCHVMLGGDMVEGLGIFPGQAHEVEAAAYEQLMFTAMLIVSVLEYLLANFVVVHVHEEIGNHGRIGRKGDHPHGDNIDRMAYTMARMQLSERVTPDRLVWNPYGGDIGTHVHVSAYTAFLFHGDEINSFGGNTPAFGILRKLNAWASGVIEPFVDAYGGHFHTPMTLTMANAGRIFMTGSPESDNGYAKEFVAAIGRPSQRLHFVDPDAGRVTTEYTLWLD